MPDTRYRPGLAALDRALSEGDVEGARQALFELDPEEQTILREELGDRDVRTLYRSARRVRRGPRLGRVIVLPGIMGTQLDSMDATGDSDRIWFNVFRILPGRVQELQLTPAGDPLPSPPTIQTRAIFPHSYLPMLMELGNRWETRPFAFDWRMDIDRSAAGLADLVKNWGNGGPVHLVAHSMGGLVSRRFMQLFPDVWASMQDPQGQGRGGRLVMLGTPNRGSFAIALALSGEEKLVKIVEKIDQQHNLRQLLAILNTFPGSYQLLPSPKLDLEDDHKKLFQASSWGGLPVHQALLNKGKSFQEALHPVVDPNRLLYVAGYGQETPHRIHFKVPGRFTYDMTLEGDGRVPHALGLLEGVATFWVNEKHGDLATNPKVLEGIHDLLLHGTTADLEVRRRVSRAGGRTSGRYDPAIRERVPEEVPVLVAEVGSGRRRGPPRLDQEIAAARLEAVALSDYLGTPPDRGLRGVAAAGRVGRERGKRRGEKEAVPPSLAVEVVWGDITEVKGDVYAVGHYQGVLPQRAELALDIAISKGARDPERRVLTEHARRGLLRGELGDIEFFPWQPGERLVAVAGMGHPGSFGESQLRRLARNLTWAVASLTNPSTVCTVLIGSGEGNLTVAAAARNLFQGLADALADQSIRSSVRLVRIVELYRERAREIHAAVLRLGMNEQITKRITLAVKPKVVRAKGGRLGSEEIVTLFLGTAVDAVKSSSIRRRRALANLLDGLPREPGLREQVARGLSEASRRRLRSAKPDERPSEPTRLSFVRDGDAIRAAAISDTATVAERILRVDLKLVDDMVARMTDPLANDVTRLSDLVRRLLVPRDFVPFLGRDRPFIFEVDRFMARVHWEFLWSEDAPGAPTSLAKWAQVSRQLRTAYSPPPAPEARSGGARRALVVGDPGDPAKGQSLPGARREAIRVAQILRSKGLEVLEMIGPKGAGTGREDAVPAERLDVLHRLMEGRFDILHYTGHGDFDESDPTRAGWVFEGGLLTSRELERMEIAPRLVVANACLSSRTSGVTGEKTPIGRSDADILPSLADEFFRRGVRDYVGTAWEVDDAGAVTFAEAFYDALLGETPATLGEAMLKARTALVASEDMYGALWAAYQHYGDPTARITETPKERRASEPGAKRKTRSRTGGKSRPSSRTKISVPSARKARGRKGARGRMR